MSDSFGRATRRSFLTTSATGLLATSAAQSSAASAANLQRTAGIKVISSAVGRLRNDRGEPDFRLVFYLLRKDGQHACVTMRGKTKFAVTDANGTRLEEAVSLYDA
jgi:hypothetical protein